LNIHLLIQRGRNIRGEELGLPCKRKEIDRAIYDASEGTIED
jgi:hypothetical protein